MKFLNTLSIKRKLIIIILMVASITIVGGFSVSTILNINDLFNELKENTILQASMVGDYCAPALIFDDKRSANEILSKLKNNPEIIYSIVLDNKENKFAEYGSIEKNYLHPNLFKNIHFVDYHNSYLHIRQPIVYQDNTYGSIYLMVSVNLLIQKIKHHLITMSAILIISIIVAYLLAINLQKSISDPILKMTSIAEKISEKEDYSIRIKDISKDEIGVLSARFNEMLHKIEERQVERDIAENALRKSEKQLKESIEHEKKNSYELTQSNKKLEEAQFGSKRMLHDLKLEIKKRRKAEKILSEHKLKLEETVTERTKSLEAETNKLKKAQSSMLELIKEKEKSRLNIEQANKLLLDANKELESFSYSVSHDLRAPLRAIDGFTTKLIEEIGDSTTDEEKRLVNIITENTSRMGKLIDDLLEFSRMNRGELNKSDVDMKTIVHEICNSIKEENKNYNLKFTIDKLPFAYCDKQLIK